MKYIWPKSKNNINEEKYSMKKKKDSLVVYV